MKTINALATILAGTLLATSAYAIDPRHDPASPAYVGPAPAKPAVDKCKKYPNGLYADNVRISTQEGKPLATNETVMGRDWCPSRKVGNKFKYPSDDEGDRLEELVKKIVGNSYSEANILVNGERVHRGPIENIGNIKNKNFNPTKKGDNIDVIVYNPEKPQDRIVVIDNRKIAAEKSIESKKPADFRNYLVTPILINNSAKLAIYENMGSGLYKLLSVNGEEINETFSEKEVARQIYGLEKLSARERTEAFFIPEALDELHPELTTGLEFLLNAQVTSATELSGAQNTPEQRAEYLTNLGQFSVESSIDREYVKNNPEILKQIAKNKYVDFWQNNWTAAIPAPLVEPRFYQLTAGTGNDLLGSNYNAIVEKCNTGNLAIAGRCVLKEIPQEVSRNRQAGENVAQPFFGIGGVKE